MNFKKSLIIGASVLTLAPVASATMVSENISADEITTSQSQEIPQSVMTFEESQQLPYANIQKDIYGEGAMLRSASNPNSIQDYKNLGYTDITYTNWDTIKYSPTRAKRVSAEIASAIVAKYAGVKVGDVLAAIGIAESVLPPEAEVWASNTTRNILAKTPAGQEVVIGQEVHIKYFSDSGRTNLVDQKSTVFWRG
ncbi:hypothetical protein ACNM7U_09025 [Aerococcus viridans]